MTRRCSRCNSDGHNLRTCQQGGGGVVKLFGVRLTESPGCIKKCASTSNLASNSQFFPSNSPNSNPGSPSSDPTRYQTRSGYASDDPNHATSGSSAHSRSERKKGTPWTEEEHRRFLVGLEKLGKGDWRGIARNYVLTRTPTQVASHAQKYFIRQSNTSTRKRRSSLFDIAVSEIQIDQQLPVEDGQQQVLPTPPKELPKKSSNQLTSLQLPQHGKEPAASSSNPIPQGTQEIIPNNKNSQLPPAPMVYPVLIPVLYPFWPAPPPTSPVLPKESRTVDEVANMSELSIGEGH